jgi:hypothetical protein
MFKLSVNPLSVQMHEHNDGRRKHQDTLWMLQVDNSVENIQALLCEPVDFIVKHCSTISLTPNWFVVDQPITMDFSYQDKPSNQITIVGMERSNRIFVSCPDIAMKGTADQKKKKLDDLWGTKDFSPELTVLVTPENKPVLAHYDLNLTLSDLLSRYGSIKDGETNVVGVTAAFLYNPYIIAHCFNKVKNRKFISVNAPDKKMNPIDMKFSVGNPSQSSLLGFSFIYQTRPINKDGKVAEIIQDSPNQNMLKSAEIIQDSPNQNMLFDQSSGTLSSCILIKFQDTITGAWQTRWLPLPPPEEGG